MENLNLTEREVRLLLFHYVCAMQFVSSKGLDMELVTTTYNLMIERFGKDVIAMQDVMAVWQQFTAKTAPIVAARMGELL